MVLTEKDALVRLKFEGCEQVYVWSAMPGEEDPDHAHDFDTKLLVVSGEIEIAIAGKKRILKAGDMFEIPRGTVHSGLAGREGCVYAVGERY